MHASEPVTHTFTLILIGADPLKSENMDRLFEAGCDDATFARRDGVYMALFDRESPSYLDALLSAIRAVEGAVDGLTVSRVEPEELVTATEIAKRLQRSRESVRQQFSGQRGDGDFPQPAAWLSNGTRLFNWPEVAAHFDQDPTATSDAEIRHRTNLFLAIRQLVAHGVLEIASEKAPQSIEPIVAYLFGKDTAAGSTLRLWTDGTPIC